MTDRVGRGGRKLSARERARLRAAQQAEQFETRQRRLRELAVEYLMAGEELEVALESVERRMRPLREEAERARQAAQRSRYATVARMRELEASEPEVAERLGISLGEVRRSMAQIRAWEAEPVAGAAATGGSGGDLADGLGADGARVASLPATALHQDDGQADGEDGEVARAEDEFAAVAPDLGGWQLGSAAGGGAAG